MKLLLTSNGLSNKSIITALFELAGKPAEEINIVFIPTAANAEEDDKSWLIDDLVNIKNQNFKQVDIVDISALPIESWMPRLEHADIISFGGGHTRHLMHWILKSGLAEILPELLKTRVYMGTSAGSIVTAPTLLLSGNTTEPFNYEDNIPNDGKALHLVNFHVRPHLNCSDFPQATGDYIQEIANNIDEIIYGLDDMSALKVVDGEVEIISEGNTLVFNKKP